MKRYLHIGLALVSFWTLKNPASQLTVKKLINLKQAAGDYDLWWLFTGGIKFESEKGVAQCQAEMDS